MLKTFFKPLVNRLLPLFQACINVGYHFTTFKKAYTIALKKKGKADYITSKAYRPIALPNTMGKTLESIMSKKLSFLAESLKFLPEIQMRARPGMSTETALELLTEQIHTIWGNGKDKAATILSLNVANAFPTTSHGRLNHNLRMRKLSVKITMWINNFLKNQKIILFIDSNSTVFFPGSYEHISRFPIVFHIISILQC